MSRSTKSAALLFLLTLCIGYIQADVANQDLMPLAQEQANKLAKAFNDARRSSDITKVTAVLSDKFQFQACRVRLDHDYAIVFIVKMLVSEDYTKPFRITVKEPKYMGNDLTMVAHVVGSVFDDDMIFDFIQENGSWKLIFGTILTCEY